MRRHVQQPSSTLGRLSDLPAARPLLPGLVPASVPAVLCRRKPVSSVSQTSCVTLDADLLKFAAGKMLLNRKSWHSACIPVKRGVSPLSLLPSSSPLALSSVDSSAWTLLAVESGLSPCVTTSLPGFLSCTFSAFLALPFPSYLRGFTRRVS